MTLHPIVYSERALLFKLIGTCAKPSPRILYSQNSNLQSHLRSPKRYTPYVRRTSLRYVSILFFIHLHIKKSGLGYGFYSSGQEAQDFKNWEILEISVLFKNFINFLFFKNLGLPGQKNLLKFLTFIKFSEF